jgi:hypothetical protein
MALASLVVVLAGCGGGGGGDGDGSPIRILGGLPPNFPDEFPLYPGLDIAESSPLGERYVIRAYSGDPARDVIDFYGEELTKGPWEVLDAGGSPDPNSTLFRFTAPGWAVDGRVQVSEAVDDSGRTIVGIAVPIDIPGSD